MLSMNGSSQVSKNLCILYIILGLYLNDVNSKGCCLANHFVLLSGLKALISKLGGPSKETILRVDQLSSKQKKTITVIFV